MLCRETRQRTDSILLVERQQPISDELPVALRDFEASLPFVN
jgi:hypothetical protein